MLKSSCIFQCLLFAELFDWPTGSIHRWKTSLEQARKNINILGMVLDDSEIKFLWRINTVNLFVQLFQDSTPPKNTCSMDSTYYGKSALRRQESAWPSKSLLSSGDWIFSRIQARGVKKHQKKMLSVYLTFMALHDWLYYSTYYGPLYIYIYRLWFSW